MIPSFALVCSLVGALEMEVSFELLEMFACSSSPCAAWSGVGGADTCPVLTVEGSALDVADCLSSFVEGLVIV